MYWKRASGLGAFSGGAIGNPNTGLEKAGKGIGSMTPKEKSAFFNKVDDIKKRMPDAEKEITNLKEKYNNLKL